MHVAYNCVSSYFYSKRVINLDSHCETVHESRFVQDVTVLVSFTLLTPKNIEKLSTEDINVSPKILSLLYKS